MCRHTCRCKTNNFQAHDFLFDSVAFLLTKKEQQHSFIFVSRHLRGSFLAVEKNISMPETFSSFFVVGRLNGNGYKTDRCPLFLTKWTRPSSAKQDWKGKKAFACAGSAGWKVPQVFVHYFKHHLFSPENAFLGPHLFFSPFWGPFMSYAYLGATM